MAQAAWANGYSILGFSAHAPLSFFAPWNLSWERMNAYADVIRALDSRWRERGMRVLLGLEIDYIPGLAGPGDQRYDAIRPDFRLGSVHYIVGCGPERFTVDEPAADFATHMAAIGPDPGRQVVREYYRSLCLLIESGGFDILGHFDLVKKNNGLKVWFDESSTFYRSLAGEAIDLAASRDRVIEINTGGIARKKTPETYPSITLLKLMREKGVRVTVGDDAHAPAHLGAYQDLARLAAREAGYGSVWYMDGKGVWRESGIGETGGR